MKKSNPNPCVMFTFIVIVQGIVQTFIEKTFLSNGFHHARFNVKH